MNSNITEICEQLKLAQTIAVFCHARPDGDALGSGLALTKVLNKAGKFAVLCCEDAAPEKYLFLKSMSDIKHGVPKDIDFDTYISVDSSDVNRLGLLSGAFTAFKGRKINIDHHISNKRFADYNYVIECPATCQIVTGIITAAEFEMDSEVANLLMLGLLTDSGNFTHKDVTGATFKTAALLCEHGASCSELSYQAFTRKSKFKATLFAKVANEMRFALDDKLAFLVIKLDYFGNLPLDGSITEGFVDFPLTIDGVEVSVSLLEVKKRQYKISFRSKGKVNVNAVAETYGGGGHLWASGCMLNGELEEVIEKITYNVYQNL